MSVILIPVALLIIVGTIALIAIAIGRSGGSRLLMIGLVAALLLLLAVGGVVLVLRMNQTHLLVTAPPETAFVGKVTVDGVEHRIEGNGRQTFTYSGGRVEYTIIPTTVDPSRTLTVMHHGQETGSAHGAHGEVTRHSLLGGSMVLGALDEDDWKRAAVELIPGRGADALSPAADGESSVAN